MLRKTFIFLMFVHGVAIADERIYKWVDENGITHCSQTPPVGEKSQELRITPSPVAIASDGENLAMKEIRKKEEEFQRRWQERKQVEADDEATRRTENANNRNQCNVARAELARLIAAKPALKNRPTISLYDPKTGKDVELMNNAERSLRIEKAENDIQKWCGPA